MKKISVLTPCYNASQYIDKCVKSLVSQTIGIEYLELIFIDDASTDNTLDKLKVWERRYSDSIIIISCTENGGPGKAKNIGEQYATAPYLFCLDSDDWLDKDVLERCYDVIENTGVDMVECPMKLEYDNGDTEVLCESVYRRVSNCKQEVDERLRNRLVEKMIYAKLFFSQGAKLLRRSFLEEFEIFMPTYRHCDDIHYTYLLWFCIRTYGIVDDTFYHAYARKDSVSHSGFSTNRIMIGAEAINELADSLLKREFGEKYKNQIEAMSLWGGWCNPVGIFLSSFDTLPHMKINELCNNIRKRYPYCCTDSAVSLLDPIDQTLLSLVEKDFDENGWNALKKAWKKLAHRQ